MQGIGATQSFTVPNAPVLTQSDFFFAPRGVITGIPRANDLDGDPGEVLTVAFGPGPFPGAFSVKGDALVFIPNGDFTGELILPYTADDGNGDTDTNTVILRNALHYAGSYRALPSVNSARLGAVDVTVNRLGKVTFTGFLDGARFRGSGELKSQGGDNVGVSLVLRKRLQPDRFLRLTWAVDRGFTAELVENDAVIYTATGLRSALASFSEPQLFTLLGTHTNVSGNAAGRATAFASLQVAPNGKTVFRGRLGDGTPFVTTSQTQEDGRVPVYTALQGRALSFLLGRLQVNPGDASSVAPGLAAVQGPVTRGTPTYAADYRDLVAFDGPRYIPPGISGEPPLTFTAFPRMLGLSASGGGIGALDFNLPVWLSRTGGINGIIGITRISIDARTGEVSGAFLPAGRRRTLPFAGILRSGNNSALGVFRGPDGAGAVVLTPQ